MHVPLSLKYEPSGIKSQTVRHSSRTLLCWSLPIKTNFILDSGLLDAAAESGEALQYYKMVPASIDLPLNSDMNTKLIDLQYKAKSLVLH